jgi:PAS domain S-box-containing protein
MQEATMIDPRATPMSNPFGGSRLASPPERAGGRLDGTARQAVADRWLAAVVESSDDAVIGMDPGGVVSSWNSSAERLFGFTAGDACGQPITLIIPHDRQAEADRLLELARAGQRLDHVETERSTKEGARLRVSLTASPVCTADGQVVGVSETVHDLSGRVALEARLLDQTALC